MAEALRDLLAAGTPRPWRIGEMYDTQDCVYADHPPSLVARVPGITSPREASATAALIVAAVNEYEALLDIEAHLRMTLGGWNGRSRDLIARLDAVRSGS